MCAVAKRPYWQKCKTGKLLRAQMREVLPDNIIVGWGVHREVDDARLRVIDAGKQFCLAKCGGCPLTEGYEPPR